MRTLKELYFASPIYRWRLAAKPLLGFKDRLSGDLPGDTSIARAILDGRMPYAFGSFKLERDPWNAEPGEPGALEHLHGFSWLRDLRELGGEAARLRARDLVDGWLARHDEWDALLDRKSTRLNSSHITISYAVFCVKKKNNKSAHIHARIDKNHMRIQPA